jgi:hypothetical protein
MKFLFDSIQFLSGALRWTGAGRFPHFKGRAPSKKVDFFENQYPAHIVYMLAVRGGKVSSCVHLSRESTTHEWSSSAVEREALI